MRYIRDSEPLCKIFTVGFKNRNKITDQMVLDLVVKMQNTTAHIHQCNCLIVDNNELNCLLFHNNFSEVAYIDVDSYQTPSCPATAIMESIRDRHNDTFSENTDWFSFGILTFQMLIGIHPFKGKHSRLKTMDERMMKHISVLNKDVSIPAICKPFNIIPQAYRDWYVAMFEEGKRMPPPKDLQARIEVIITPTIITGNEQLDISRINKFDSNIIDFLTRIDRDIVITEHFVYTGKHTHDPIGKSTHFCFSESNKIICAHTNNGLIELRYAEIDKEIRHTIGAESLMTYDGRLYIKIGDKIGEATFIESAGATHATTRTVAQVLPNATALYDGCVIQNLLGACVVSIFQDSAKSYQITLPDISGYKVVDAKYDNHILIIIGNKKGKYDRFVFKLDSGFKNYELRKVKNISYQGINFVTLDNGVVICINEEEDIEIFSNRIGENSLKVINNNAINGNMKLYRKGTSVIFSEGHNLYRMTMKSP
jgi:serine/threonine protein kinase